MENEKFTPGEWEFIGGGIYVGDAHIAEVYASYDEASDYEEEQDANANLIAAAPEMYRMLKYLADGIRWGGMRHTDRSLAAEIEKLLKKARGEE